MDRAIGAFTSAIDLRMVGGGEGCMDPPDKAQVLENGALKVSALIGVYLDGWAEVEKPRVLEG